MSGDKNAEIGCCESEADRQPSLPSTHVREGVSPQHPDFLDPTATAGVLVRGHSCPSLPQGKGFKSSEKVPSTSQAHSSFTSSRRPLPISPPWALHPLPCPETMITKVTAAFTAYYRPAAVLEASQIYLNFPRQPYERSHNFRPILQMRKTQRLQSPILLPLPPSFSALGLPASVLLCTWLVSPIRWAFAERGRGKKVTGMERLLVPSSLRDICKCVS